MGTSASGGQLGAALDDEIIRLETTMARAGMWMAGVGVGLAGYTAVAISQKLGVALMGFAAVLLLWFGTVRLCLSQGVGARVFQWVNPLLEISLPTVLVLIDLRTQGAAYAAASSVPMQFYAIFLLGSVLRLKNLIPLVAGLVGAAEYALVYLLILQPALPAEMLENPAFRPDMMLMRAVIIAVGGLVGMIVNRTLRHAVGEAGSQWRAHQLFGKYRILDVLAQGGMGSVHRALYCPEGGFQRPVALKRIHLHLAANDSFVAAFRNEAELCSRLTHPNIVQVLDFGRVDDTYFLAMEFVDGMTLADLLRNALQARRALPPAVVALIGREICEGLHYAHHAARDANGKLMRVVHRDLNPPNLLISRTGEVKITDFGIARALGEARSALTGSAVGKAAYLAPEQASEEPLDERCDLFALGIILWEALCLRRLFHRSTEAASMMAVISDPVPPPSTIRKDINAGLWDAFFVRALARDRDARFLSASGMRDALTEIMRAEGMPQPDALEKLMAALPSPPPKPSSPDDATQRPPDGSGQRATG